MGLRADSVRPQRVSGSARIDSQRAESARNPIASHVNFGDDSALSALTRTQWTAAFTLLMGWHIGHVSSWRHNQSVNGWGRLFSETLEVKI